MVPNFEKPKLFVDASDVSIRRYSIITDLILLTASLCCSYTYVSKGGLYEVSVIVCVSDHNLRFTFNVRMKNHKK